MPPKTISVASKKRNPSRSHDSPESQRKITSRSSRGRSNSMSTKSSKDIRTHNHEYAGKRSGIAQKRQQRKSTLSTGDEPREERILQGHSNSLKSVAPSGSSRGALTNPSSTLQKGKRTSSTSRIRSTREGKEKVRSADTVPRTSFVPRRGGGRGKPEEKEEDVLAKTKKKLKEAQDQISLLQAKVEALEQLETSFLCQKEIDTLHQLLEEQEKKAEKERKQIHDTFRSELEKQERWLRGQEEGYQIEKKSFLHSIDILSDSFVRERQKREDERVDHIARVAALQSEEEWLESALAALRDRKSLDYASEESKQEYGRLFARYGSLFTSTSMTKEEGLLALWEALGKTARWRESIRPAQLQLLLSRFSCSQLTFRVCSEHHLELGGAAISEEEVGGFFTVLLSRIGSLVHLAILDCPVSPVVWDDFPLPVTVEVSAGQESTDYNAERASKAIKNRKAEKAPEGNGHSNITEGTNEESPSKPVETHGDEISPDGPSTEKVLSQPFPALQSLALWHTKVSAHDVVQLVRLLPSLQHCGYQTIMNGISVHEKCLSLEGSSVSELMNLCRGKLWVWGRLVTDCSDIII